MNSVMDDSFYVYIVFASLGVQYLAPITTAIKTMYEKNVTWDSLAKRRIEESRTVRSNFK